MYNTVDKIYPKSRDWASKVLTMPNIPRGKGYPVSLSTILMALKGQKPYGTIIEIDGSERKSSLDQMCVTLRPPSIVFGNSKKGWVISNEALKWLDTGEDLYLAAILNANIKFFSEILHILSEGKCQVKKLLRVAVNEYELPWKTKQEVLIRLNWLKDLELIEYEEYSYNYLITELGIKFLNEVGYIDYKSLSKETDYTSNESEVQISDWALKLCEINENEERKDGIGYFPGSVSAMHKTLMEYLKLMNKPTNIQYLYEYSSTKYGIKHSSVRGFLTPLKHLGFVEQISKTAFQITNAANRLSIEHLEMDFACCIHNKYNYVFEILEEIGDEKLTVKEIHDIGRNLYNFKLKNTGEIHKRIHVLKNAKLIQETGSDSYGLTHRGRNFYEMIKNHLTIIKNHGDEAEVLMLENENSRFLNEILYEIKDASQDSTNPDRFEEALKVGFSLLGFKANRISGAGKTDVLLNAPTVPKFSYSVSIDAKSTYYNEVPESSVDFITINEHKRKHKADFAAIVGINFGKKSRLIKRAEEHNVLLIDINSLTEMLNLHNDAPINADSYKKIFSQTGLVNIQALEEDCYKIEREGLLMQSIIDCLSEQSIDSYTKGMISAREIYFILKSDVRFVNSPDISEIQLMLELLASPLIGCVGKEKELYYALGSSSDAAQKFQFYYKACAENISLNQ